MTNCISLGVLGEVPGIAAFIKEEVKKFLKPRFFESHDQIVFWMGERLYIYWYFLPLDTYIPLQVIPVNGLPQRLGNRGFMVSEYRNQEFYAPDKEGNYGAFLRMDCAGMEYVQCKDRDLLVSLDHPEIFDLGAQKVLSSSGSYFFESIHFTGTNFFILNGTELHELVEDALVFREKFPIKYRSGSVIKGDTIVLREDSRSFGYPGKVSIATLPNGKEKLKVLQVVDGAKYIVLGGEGLLVYYKECLSSSLYVPTKDKWEVRKNYIDGEPEDLRNGRVFYRSKPNGIE